MSPTSKYSAATLRRNWWESAEPAVFPKEKTPEKENGGLFARVRKFVMAQIVGEDPRPYGSDRFAEDCGRQSWQRHDGRATYGRGPEPRCPTEIALELAISNMEALRERYPDQYAPVSLRVGRILGMRPAELAHAPAELAREAHRIGADAPALFHRQLSADADAENVPDVSLFDRSCSQKNGPDPVVNELKTSTWRRKKK